MSNDNTITKEEFRNAVNKLDDHITHPTQSKYQGWILTILGALVVGFITQSVVSYDQIGDLDVRVTEEERKSEKFVTLEYENSQHRTIIGDIENLEERFVDNKGDVDNKFQQIIDGQESLRKDFRQMLKEIYNGGAKGGH